MTPAELSVGVREYLKSESGFTDEVAAWMVNSAGGQAVIKLALEDVIRETAKTIANIPIGELLIGPPEPEGGAKNKSNQRRVS
jgi:hypothetical protein